MNPNPRVFLMTVYQVLWGFPIAFTHEEIAANGCEHLITLTFLISLSEALLLTPRISYNFVSAIFFLNK